MKVLRLDLIAFGPFTNQTLDLSAGAEGLHLIFGPNEAGKSSALRAIRQAFTGIPARSTDDFVHHHSIMRIGVALRNRRGDVFEFIRRKGNKSTLLGPDQTALDDSALDTFLGRIDKAEFAFKSVLDHAELVQGGRDLIEGRGDLGVGLFSAGAGIAGLNGARKRLEQECEELFKKGGSKPKINAACSDLEAKRRALKAAALPSADWVQHADALSAARRRKEVVDAELADARRAVRRLRRFAQALEPSARRADRLDALRPLADAVVLPADFAVRHREALSLLNTAEHAEHEARQAIAELDRQRAAVVVDDGLLEQAELIEPLHHRLGGHQQAQRDRSRWQVEAEQFAADAESIRHDLGGNEPQPLTTAERVALQDLGNDRQTVFKARDDSRKAVEKHAAKTAEATRKRQALGPARDPAALKKAVTRAQRQGDLDEADSADQTALRRDDRQAAGKLAALGLWSGPLDDLPRLPVPSAETLDRFQSEFNAAAADRDAARARSDELDAQARETEAALARLRLEGNVPTEDDLIQARRQRDQRWGELQAARDEPGAISAFERSMAEADAIADRLRREARRVAEQAQLLADRARTASGLADQHARRDRAEARRAEIQERWTDLWAPLGIVPLSPREMLGWSRKHAELATLARSLLEKRLTIAERRERIEQHRRDLGAVLEALGEPSAAPGEALATLIERGHECVETLNDAASARKRLDKELGEAETDRPHLDQQAEAASAALDRWQARWAVALLRIGLPADASPSMANAVAGRVAELSEKIEKTRDRRRRIEAIDDEANQFAAAVRAVADRVAPDLALAPPASAAAELTARLARARDAHQRRAALTQRINREEHAAREARDTVAAMQGRLALLCREARCESEDQLAAVAERSRQRQKVEQDLDGLNDQLRLLAAGEPLDDFSAAIKEHDPDALGDGIDRLDEQIQALDEEKAALDQTIGREQAELARMNGSPDAADIEEEAEALRARIKTDVEQYARLRLASALLREGIERYRHKSQGPVLERAGALFAALTLGSFAGLKVDYNDRDEPVLKGVRPGGQETVGVEGMSLGAADQLYLALRLASLDATARDDDDLAPLIVDDILIQFDDERAGATLDALAELSRRRQVLLFTHHQHIVALARSRVPADMLRTHTLHSRPAPALRESRGG